MDARDVDNEEIAELKAEDFRHLHYMNLGIRSALLDGYSKFLITNLKLERSVSYTLY